MRGELKRLQQRLGITTIFVTHDQVEAMTLSDRIVVMESGTVQQIGKPLEIYRRPANLFVARFVGSPSMNFFHGHLLAEGGGSFVSPNLRAAVTLPEHAPTNGVTFGIRPEELALSTRPTEGSAVGEIVLVEPLGHETIAHVALGSDLVRSRVTDNGDDLAIGQQVWLRLGEHLLFDTQTGALLS